MKNNFVKLAGVLLIIGAVSAGVLAWLNDVTSDRIAQNEAMASMDPAILEAVMPGSVMFNDYEDTALVDTIKADNNKFINLLTAVDESGNELGKVIRTWSTVKGFNGDLELYVGFTPDGQISGTSVISHAETEGVGSLAIEELPDKIAQANSTDVDDISGATKTSQGIKQAVDNAIQKNIQSKQ